MIRAALVAALAAGLTSTSALAGDLTVTVRNIAPGIGTVYVALCQGALKKEACRTGVAQSARNPSQTFRFNDLAPGIYAAVVYQDANGNGRLDRTLIGLPKEPYAFSNNIGRFSMPTFRKAAVRVGGRGTGIAVRLYDFPLDEVPADQRS